MPAFATEALTRSLYKNPQPYVVGQARPQAKTYARDFGDGWLDQQFGTRKDLTCNFTGSLPILEVLNIDGVADQSDIMVVAANTNETLTATFTPTADGVCRVRVRSQDTSSDGEAFFDDLTVT